MKGKFVLSKPQPTKAHAQNSVERPQNRCIKPFQFQPGQSGNPGDRPKLLSDAVQRRLHEKITDPDEPTRQITRADLIARNIAETAASAYRNNVAAFKELRAMSEPEEVKDAAHGPVTISMDVLRDLCRAAGEIEENFDDIRELPTE
jgi:uncharacterized protein DUF5681